MSLVQLDCPLDEPFGDSLSTLLEEDALSISWVEKEPENWGLEVIAEASAESLIRNQIAAFLKEKNKPVPEITSHTLASKDWVQAVYQDFPPLTLGRFYIYGSHIQKDLPPDLIPLHIDAATAFGSGHHESTEGCLKALSLLSTQGPFYAPLDMGCGSGILALAMAHLWKRPVFACDNDPESVRVTLENARLNHLDTLITAQVSDGFSSLKHKFFDIITANILAGPLCHMAHDVSTALKPDGVIVLAGLLNRQAEDVIDAYRSAGLKLVDQFFVKEWSTLIMRKTDHG